MWTVKFVKKFKQFKTNYEFNHITPDCLFSGQTYITACNIWGASVYC